MRWKRCRSQPVSVSTGSAAGATAGALLSFVDPESPTVELSAIQRLHGARGVRVRHFNEAEAARATCVAIRDQGDLFDGSVLGEQCAHALIGRRKGEISNV